MTTVIAPVLYTEARLNIESTHSNSTLHISTESAGLFSGRKRLRTDAGEIDQDEDSYAKRHLASEGSVFFRRKSRSPRSFLWRVLQDRKLLEVHCVDLVQSRRSTQESILTFALTFANPIRPNGIAFADPDLHDALEIFVLTTSNELFTFSLGSGVLLKHSVPSPSDFDPESCYKCYKPTSFSFKHPYKLVATSSRELFISLHDGGLLRLDRNSGDNGSSWRETFFSEGGWGSTFRGLIPFRSHNTVKFGDVDLEPTTPAAIEMSPDGAHLFTVSLDHTLKAWNMQTGKTAVQTDILGENHKENTHASQYLINPNQASIMKIVDVDGRPDGDMYYVVTNSPKDHQFKFWAIRDADSVAHGIRDVQSDAKLIPPLDELMNTNVWQLIEFHIRPGRGWRDTKLWIRVRAGASVKLFTLTFDLLAAPEDLEDVWQNNWAAVDEGSLTVEALMNNPQYPAESDTILAADDASGPTERWLDFIFYPGRFSIATLESALFVFRKGLKLLSESSREDKHKPLKERLCSAISAKIAVDQTANGQVDFERYQSGIAAQWHTYFGLIRLLHGRRADSLALSYDIELDVPWSVRADFVSPIRTCSELEVMQMNQEIFTTQDENYIVNSMPLANFLPDDSCVSVARLLVGARMFRQGLSPFFQSAFDQASTTHALQISSDGTPNGVQDKHSQDVLQLYDACALGSEVSDDDFNTLTDFMQDLGGLGELNNEIFLTAIDRFSEGERGADEEQALTRYGDKITIRGAQETLQSAHEAILDLLTLVIFMAGDLEPEELSPDFHASDIYEQLMSKLKEHKILLWLASNVRYEPTKRIRDAADDLSMTKQSAQPALTLFESIFIGDWQSLRLPAESLTALITYWSRAWTYGANLTTAYNGVVMHIMGNLVKYSNFDLAADFERFLPNKPWAHYLRGRLCLALGDYTLASVYLKQGAEDLSSKNNSIDSFDTSGVLKVGEKGFFAEGLPRYYLHVSSLFEALKIYTYTADFASLALEVLGHDDDALSDLDARKRSLLDSPAAMQVDMAMEELRLLRTQELKEDILSRVFNASLQTCHYQRAFTALLVFANPALRKASLQSLLQSLIQRHDTQTLLELPFPPFLISEVDSILVGLARKHLPFSPVSTSTPQYHQVLYTWRIHNNDFRGAAEILFERLQRLKQATAKIFEPDDETLVEAYLVLINTLACLGKEDGWVLAESIEGEQSGHKSKRRIVTLDDVRREYQGELDRRSEMQQGRFPLLGGAGEAMDVL